jgi:hypothetical protein
MWEFDLEKPNSPIPTSVLGLQFQRYQARYGTFEISTGTSAPSSTPACIRKLKTELRDRLASGVGPITILRKLNGTFVLDRGI